MMRLKILETISTVKWFWHSGTVMMMNDGVDDEIEDGVRLTETNSTEKWFWHSGTVMMMNDGVDDEIEDSAFGSFCFVLFGFIWGVGSNYVWIYAQCIRIFLCTITAPICGCWCGA